MSKIEWKAALEAQIEYGYTRKSAGYSIVPKLISGTVRVILENDIGG